jgi:hypothetical protein
LEKPWTLALWVKSAYLAKWAKNAFNSVGTLALKPGITVTRMTEKINTSWRMNAVD